MNSTGSTASSTISVAYSIGPRTASDACTTSASAGWVLPCWRARRRWRAIWPASPMASSTITDTASIRPAMIIMSMLSPRRWNTQVAAISEVGMAMAATSAARQLAITASSASTTSK